MNASNKFRIKKNSDPQDIKELYHLHWEIETSYHELKYDLDLNTLHSKKTRI